MRHTTTPDDVSVSTEQQSNRARRTTGDDKKQQTQQEGEAKERGGESVLHMIRGNDVLLYRVDVDGRVLQAMHKTQKNIVEKYVFKYRSGLSLRNRCK